MRRLEAGGKLIARRLATSSVALLFGSEKFGLSNEDMSYCHWLMRIPSREEHGSMNLGQAVAVCLYEMIRDPKAANLKPEPQKPADGEDLERLTVLLDEVLTKSGYVHKVTEDSTELKLRRLARRMNLNEHDVKVWLGMVRQILWKLKS
jgi:tRNA/rRNA methyltransferase